MPRLLLTYDWEKLTAVILDEQPWAQAQELCGSLKQTSLHREALQERESARRLAISPICSRSLYAGVRCDLVDTSISVDHL